MFRDMIIGGYHYDNNGNLVNHNGDQVDETALRGRLHSLKAYGGDDTREGNMFKAALDL